MRYGFLFLVSFIFLSGCGAVVVTEKTPPPPPLSTPSPIAPPVTSTIPAPPDVTEGLATEGLAAVELIRVLVITGAEQLEIEGASGHGPLSIRPASGGQGGQGDELIVNGEVLSAPVFFIPEKDFIYVNSTPYRGTLEVATGYGGKLSVIDELPLESYLVGLINSEISSKWPEEAIKTQAVVARTYAIYQKQARSGSAFHLTNTNMDQVYGGAQGEDIAALIAVKETAGVILAYRGEPALALYHSNAGGRTEAAKDVWVADYPYLRAVTSPYDRGAPNFNWEFAASGSTLKGLLTRAGYTIGEPVRITVAQRSPTKRVKKILIKDGSGHTLTLSGENLRKALGYAILRSTLFKVEKTSTGFLFKGRGSGHGVGLSQWGAKGMAARGYSYRQILGHFYPGTGLMKAY